MREHSYLVLNFFPPKRYVLHCNWHCGSSDEIPLKQDETNTTPTLFFCPFLASLRFKLPANSSACRVKEGGKGSKFFHDRKRIKTKSQLTLALFSLKMEENRGGILSI